MSIIFDEFFICRCKLCGGQSEKDSEIIPHSKDCPIVLFPTLPVTDEAVALEVLKLQEELLGQDPPPDLFDATSHQANGFEVTKKLNTFRKKK